MPLVIAKNQPLRKRLAPPIGPQALWKPSSALVRKRDDFYTSLQKKAYQPAKLDVDLRGLGDLGDMAGPSTGIAFIDDNVKQIMTAVDQAAFASKITMYCSIAAGMASILLLFRTRHLR